MVSITDLVHCGRQKYFAAQLGALHNLRQLYQIQNISGIRESVIHFSGCKSRVVSSLADPPVPIGFHRVVTISMLISILIK